jgi:hypothetical protein
MQPAVTFVEASPSLAARVRSGAVRHWGDVEDEFVRALATVGERSSAVEGALAEVLAALVQNDSGVVAATSVPHPSSLVRQRCLDLVWPASGEPVVVATVDAVCPGTGLDDLHDRVRRVACTAMECKQSHGRPRAFQSLQAWLDVAEPAVMSFWIVRVDSVDLLDEVRSVLAGLRGWCNGVGALCYSMVGFEGRCRRHRWPEFAIDRVLRDVGQRVAIVG